MISWAVRSQVACVAAAVAFAGLSGHATADETPSIESPAWTVQVDYLTTALGFVHVLLERRIGKSMSVYGGPHARVFRGIVSEDDEHNTGYGVEFGARYFFLDRTVAPEGLWAQARVVAARVSLDGESTLGGYISAIGGYSLIVRDRWVIAGGVGIQYIHYSVGGVGPEGVIPAAHTAVGVAF